MKTINVTDALAADLVAKNEAEYATQPTPALAPALPPHLTALLPPVVARAENGKRVDQPSLQGTPGTVTLTATGHTLSLPDVAHENFSGYCDRVWRQAEGAPGVAGALVMGGQAEFFFDRFGGYKADGSNWPQAADFLFDRHMGRHAYDTGEERAAQAAAQPQWDATSAAVGHGDSTPPAAPVEVPVPVVEEPQA